MYGYPMNHGAGHLIITEDGHSLPQSVGAGYRLPGRLSTGALGSWRGFIRPLM